jgi:hypothetical protein
MVLREAMKLAVRPEYQSLPNPLPGTIYVLGAPFPVYRLAVLGICRAFDMSSSLCSNTPRDALWRNHERFSHVGGVI